MEKISREIEINYVRKQKLPKILLFRDKLLLTFNIFFLYLVYILLSFLKINLESSYIVHILFFFTFYLISLLYNQLFVKVVLSWLSHTSVNSMFSFWNIGNSLLCVRESCFGHHFPLCAHHWVKRAHLLPVSLFLSDLKTFP